MRSRSAHQKASTNVTPIQAGTSPKMELRPDLWDSRYSPKEREKLMVVAQQYGLDPMTHEVIILRGKIYVTAAGLQKLALNDPNYDGCEIELVETDWKNNFFVVKASVWKKNCSHPFEDYGDADPTTSTLRGHALFRHAITRARARAMRSAFAIPFCSLEELDDEARWNNASKEERGTQHKGTKRAHKAEEKRENAASLATEQQLSMLENYRKNRAWNTEELAAYIEDRCGVRDPKTLTREQISMLLGELSKPAETPETAITTADESTPKKPSQEAMSKVTTTAKGSLEAVKEAQEVPQKEPAPEPKELAVSEPKASYKPQQKNHSKAKKAQRSSTLPRWTPEEQRRIADDLVQRMQNAKSMKELRREWELFQGVRHQLSEQWFSQICETKEQRKAALAHVA